MTLSPDESTGTWRMETIDGISAQGTCLLWKPTRDPESPCAQADSPAELLSLWHQPAD